MNDQELKQVIIDTLSEQQAFRDLAPVTVAGMAIDMVLAVLKKVGE